MQKWRRRRTIRAHIICRSNEKSKVREFPEPAPNRRRSASDKTTCLPACAQSQTEYKPRAFTIALPTPHHFDFSKNGTHNTHLCKCTFARRRLINRTVIYIKKRETSDSRFLFLNNYAVFSAYPRYTRHKENADAATPTVMLLLFKHFRIHCALFPCNLSISSASSREHFALFIIAFIYLFVTCSALSSAPYFTSQVHSQPTIIPPRSP